LRRYTVAPAAAQSRGLRGLRGLAGFSAADYEFAEKQQEKAELVRQQYRKDVDAWHAEWGQDER